MFDKKSYGRRMESLEARRLLAAVSWDGGGDGTHWLDPFNWSTNTLPTAADDVTIDVPSAITVSLDGSSTQQINSLNLRETLRLNLSTLTIGTLFNGGTVDLSADSNLRTTGAAFFTGIPSATLRVELASATVYGRLTVGTTLSLDDASSLSTLSVVPLAGFDPASYLTVQPVTAQIINGAFDTYSGGVTSSGKSLHLSNAVEETSFFNAGGFEDSNYIAGSDLSATSPWVRSGAGSITGNVGNFANGSSKGVTLSRPSTVLPFSALREYPNVPAASAPAGRDKMWISWDMYLPEPNASQPQNYGPFFGMEAYGSLPLNGYTRIAAAGVDAKTGEVLWLNPSLQTGTPSTFVDFNQWHHFDLVLNYANNTYAIAIDGEIIPQATAIPFQGIPTAMFGDADLTVVQADLEPPVQSGVAHFDNYNVGWRSNTISTTSRQALALRAVTGAVAAPVATPTFEFERQQALNITFDQDVSTSISKEDFQLVTRPGNTPVSTSAALFSYNPATRTATLNFQGQLPDGNYRLTLAPGAVQSASGAASAAKTLDFYVLSGDLDRDRDVDFADLLRLAQNYGQFDRTFSQGNIDYDASGEVDFGDLLLLAQRYGTSVPLLAPLVAETGVKTRRGIASDVFA